MRKDNFRYQVIKIFCLVCPFLLATASQAQVVIQRCDVVTGWQGASAFSVDQADKKEGGGSLKIEAQAGNSVWYEKSFTDTYTGISNTGYLSFWLYISDVSKLDGGKIEISSSGGPDNNTFNWPLGKDDVVDGWNLLQLQISSAIQTDGGADLENINFFKIDQTLSGPVTAKIDFIRFSPGLNSEVWPVLQVPEVNNSSLDGKVMFGYQGWFNHPDDGAGLGWIHWGNLYNPILSHVDMYPDMREYGLDEKYDTHYTMADGSMAPVFSSHNRNTVVRHMKWVRDYNLDGVFIQRFISASGNSGQMNHKDTVTKHVMEGCEKYGRVFAIMYDGIAGRVDAMKNDWIHLVDDIGVANSDRYLHHRGLPLVSLWGYTVRDEATVAELEEMIDFFTNNPEPKYRASVKLGVAWNWYDRSAWMDAFKKVAVISPWFSGSTNYDKGQAWCDQNNVDFLPVVHPGFSWYNLSLNYQPSLGAKDLNTTPRDGGNYLWNEVNHVVSKNAKSVFIAMYDEIDEGTAMFKLAENSDMLPREGSWVPLDIDGYELPSDWYLRNASLAANVVRGYEDNNPVLADLGTPPEGIMTIRILNETNDGDNGAMEFIFPDFPDETTIEISIDSGVTFAYSTPDIVGTYVVPDLTEGIYPVFVRHGAGSAVVDMGDVFIGNVYEGLPMAASKPYPSDKATDVRINTAVGWTSGEYSVSHIIYFGTSETPDSVGRQTNSTYNPGDLAPYTTFYWRIDEENGSGITEGPVWSFTTSGIDGPTGFAVLDYCDEISTWKSHNSVVLDPDEKQEGFACLYSEGSGASWFHKKFDNPVNSRSDITSYLDLWIYVSDVSKFNGGGQLEIGSSGRADDNEYAWSTSTLGLQNGWNDLHLPLASAGKIGNPDLSAINWFRLYQFVSEPIETRIDFIRFTELAYDIAPTNLTAVPGDQQAALDWDDNTEEDLAGYNVYRSLVSGSAYEKMNQALVVESAFTDINLNNGTTYYYVVTAENNTQKESYQSNEVSCTPGTSSLGQIDHASGIKIYPNPAKNLVTLELSLDELSDVNISIHDISGRNVGYGLQEQEVMPGNYQFKIPLTEIKRGTYIVKLRINDLLISELLVIN